MASDGEIARRMGDLERVVMARLADQEEQLRALQHGATPAGGLSLLAFRVKRKARRVPASVRRRLRQRRRDRRVARERPVISPSEASRRTEIVDRYIDVQGTAVGESAGTVRSIRR
jgi:hypothetical protein